MILRCPSNGERRPTGIDEVVWQCLQGESKVSEKGGLEDDDPLGRLLFSSFRQSKNVTFLDDVSSVSGAGRLQVDEGKTPGKLTVKRSTTSAEKDCNMKTGSLKAETRGLWQNGWVPDSTVNGPSSGHQWSRKSKPVYNEEAISTAGVENDEGDNRAEYHRGQLLSRGERNRLGLGTPFVGPEEGSLAESASIPLSFLSSYSPSFEVLPKPDISGGLFSEALLQSAELNEANADTTSQEQQDASLVADFMAGHHARRVFERRRRSSTLTSAQRCHGTTWPKTREGRPNRCGQDGDDVLKEAAEIEAPAAASGAAHLEAAVTEIPAEIPNNDDDNAGKSYASTSSSTDIEHLAEILNRLKITQLGSEHHQRERTRHREYGFVPPFKLGLAVGPRWPKTAIPAAAAFPVVELGVGLGATMPTVETATALAEPRARLPPSPPAAPIEPAPKTTPTLPPLRESHEYSTEHPSSVECDSTSLSSDFRAPAEIHSVSSQDDKAELEDAALSSSLVTVAAGPVQRRRPSPAQLYKERTASRRLVPPAAPSSRRPVPLKRSIHFSRTTASQLQVIAEVFHGARLLSPLPLARKTPVRGEGEAHGGSSPEKAAVLSPVDDEDNVEQPLEGMSPPEPKARTYRDATNDNRGPPSRHWGE
ncbi:hypothetical protein MTO96_027428 [Rhipicephalus appendiculatus]